MHVNVLFYTCPRADGAKRRARVLIPPRLFTPGETKALGKSKVHQISRAHGVCVVISLISKYGCLLAGVG
jgi:hypothetical protein